MIARVRTEAPAGVILCTQRSVFGDLLEEALKNRPEIGWIRRSSSGPDVLAAVRARKPDAVLLDATYTKESMFDLARALSRLKSRPPVIFFADSAAIGWIYRSLAVGASGYLARCADIDEFVRAIQAVRQGMRFFSPSAATIVSDMATGAPTLPSFSQRELDVLGLICEGFSTKEVSRELHMEPKTVDSIRARLMDKTRTTNAASLVRYACDERFVDAHPRVECEEGESGRRMRPVSAVPLRTR